MKETNGQTRYSCNLSIAVQRTGFIALGTQENHKNVDNERKIQALQQRHA